MLSLKLALKFYLSKKYGPLARFMSIASTTGIALGVAALIIGLSAMNGFERELHSRVLSVIPNATLNAQNDYFRYSDNTLEILSKSSHIQALSTAVELDCVVTNNKDFYPVKLMGVDPKSESKVVSIQNFMSAPLSELYSDNDEIKAIIGANLAKKLKVNVGDELKAFGVKPGSEASSDLLSHSVKFTIKVAGLLKIGGELDSSLVYIAYDKALHLASLQGPNAIHIKTDDLLKARNIVVNAAKGLTEGASLSTWITSQGKLYNDIMMIRQIMYLAMILVMAVACFNIISNLIMTVTEKKREIAILLTMGLKRSQIIQSFCLLGLISGSIGTAIGAFIGIAFSVLLTPFTEYLKNSFGIVLLNEDLYFISFIPSQLKLSDIMIIVTTAMSLSVAASLYPALKASRTNVVDGLNY
ncbi:FtsX-like permease family protein [Anaerobiospirillum thomasii]|uniref:Lipoprotein-releasing system transmembrane protein lolE n=1 Tax=Anaerobiospirillum thomasii TaxID=179995 RepID=A0A2X0V917_9GAMM|nr:FtsX-like permease family protein [Anaerobiospirillum thomasii]SPT69626.1 Lipoprotein-releasing system transmembrane protein lolE [Anaerobiospirillum thomasii]